MSRSISCLLALLVTGAVLTAQEAPTRLVYRASVQSGGAGGFHFTIEVAPPPAGELRFVAPYFAPGAWRPITVRPRSGAKSWTRLQDFHAEDETGRERRITQEGDRSWRVEAAGATKIILNYRNAEPGSRPNNRSYLTATSGLLDGPRSWLYLEGAKDLPAEVHFDLPEGWRIATGLDPAGPPGVFTAPDYDRLIDCPTLVGNFHTWDFVVEGIPHIVAVDTGGRRLRFDPGPFVAMVRRIVEVYAAFWGGLPYEHYTFMYTPGSGGGLEHLNSTTIAPGPQAAFGGASWLKNVTAHEFFHVWNVKRLRPVSLGPFDYTGPARVRDLWICEGLTDYYTNIGLWRAGLLSDREFLESYRRSLASFEGSPNRVQHVISPEEASWTVWDSGGSISYYLQGDVLGLALDLAIRDGTQNRKSLDDVMRHMYRRFGGERGYESSDWIEAIRIETGLDLAAFFARHVSAAEPVPWNDYLAAAGWRLQIEETAVAALARSLGGSRRREGQAWLETVEKRVVLHVPPGSAAAVAGFVDGDRLLELQGGEVSSRSRVRSIFRGLTPGEQLRATVEREGQRVEFEASVLASNECSFLGLEERDGAVVLTGVPTSTALYRGGLRRGDRLVAIDGSPAGPVERLRARLEQLPVGKVVRFAVRRGEDAKALELQMAPLTRVRVRKLLEVAEPTQRQLAIREGLRTGTTRGVESRVLR